jgi:hypothetical protein
MPLSPYPERFAGSYIAEIEFEKNDLLDDRKLYLTVQHPGFGALIRSNECIVVDLRTAQSEGRIYQTTPIPPFAHKSRERGQLRATSLGENFYTLYPLRAPYYLNTELVNFDTKGSDKPPPKIKRLEIVLQVVQ